MKRNFIFTVGSIALAGFMFLTSCSKSKEDLIKEYNKTAEEAVEAVKEHDMEKYTELCKKGTEILKELDTKDLTMEDRAQLSTAFYELPREMGM